MSKCKLDGVSDPKPRWMDRLFRDYTTYFTMLYFQVLRSYSSYLTEVWHYIIILDDIIITVHM